MAGDTNKLLIQGDFLKIDFLIFSEQTKYVMNDSQPDAGFQSHSTQSKVISGFAILENLYRVEAVLILSVKLFYLP